MTEFVMDMRIANIIYKRKFVFDIFAFEVYNVRRSFFRQEILEGKMTDFQMLLANEFHIPIKDENQKIWMLRTESGKFYRDFTTNNYVALGWDKVPFSLIANKDTTNIFKKEQIQLLYPDESKPGLILSQLNTFYFKMKSEDLILIPSRSSERLFIGKLGDIITNVEHEESDEEYAKCEYLHKRSVEWIKDISPNVDVYLNKALRSHQAITDVSKYSGVFYRNVFPYYIDGVSLHITFKKQTDSSYSVLDSINLQSSVVKIFQSVSALYNVPDNSETYIIKTAVGSQGIIEFIVQNFNDSNIVAILFLLTALGGSVSKDSDGKISFSIGVTGIIDKINSLVNDYKNRKMIDAEIKIKEAEARKIDAETEKIRSETKSNSNIAKATVKTKLADAEKTKAEAVKIISESKKADAETEQIKSRLLQTPTAQQVQNATSNLSVPMNTLQQIANQNNINISA